MSWNTYQRIAFKDTIAITASATTTHAIAIPRFMGIGGIVQFFFKMVRGVGTPSITITAIPVRVVAVPEFPGDTIASANYALITGYSAQTLTYFTGSGDAAFSAISMADGGWYQVLLNLHDRPWDGVELSFANGTGGGSTGTITGEIAIG